MLATIERTATMVDPLTDDSGNGSRIAFESQLADDDPASRLLRRLAERSLRENTSMLHGLGAQAVQSEALLSAIREAVPEESSARYAGQITISAIEVSLN